MLNNMKQLINAKMIRVISLSFIICHLSFSLCACSESEDEEASEYGSSSTWQQRNEAFFASLEDSLSRQANVWKKLKSFAKDETVASANTDYIYARVLETGDETSSPMYTDSVRISYRGKLIPSASYADGYVFDQTFIGSFSWKTTAVIDNLCSGFINGFTTALLHMHRGDRWRIYIPYQLGYGKEGSGSSIPGYSTLVFDIALVDFCSTTEWFPKWSARER